MLNMGKQENEYWVWTKLSLLTVDSQGTNVCICPREGVTLEKIVFVKGYDNTIMPDDSDMQNGHAVIEMEDGELTSIKKYDNPNTFWYSVENDSGASNGKIVHFNSLSDFKSGGSSYLPSPWSKNMWEKTIFTDQTGKYSVWIRTKIDTAENTFIWYGTNNNSCKLCDLKTNPQYKKDGWQWNKLGEIDWEYGLNRIYINSFT